MFKLTSRRVIAALGVLVLVLTGVVITSSSEAAQKTKKLHGKMEGIHNTHNPNAPPPAAFFGPADPGCQSASGVCSRFTGKGDIKGDGLVFIDTFPSQDVPSYSKAHTTVITKKGTFACTEAALFDLQGADHAFVDLCIIDGAMSTGIYAGATGYIQEEGTFDFNNNVGQLEYQGKITYADGVKPNDMDGDD